MASRLVPQLRSPTATRRSSSCPDVKREAEKVKALDAGASDYPDQALLGPRAARAHPRGASRSLYTSGIPSSSTAVSFGRVQPLELERRRLATRKGRPVHLSQIEFNLHGDASPDTPTRSCRSARSLKETTGAPPTRRKRGTSASTSTTRCACKLEKQKPTKPQFPPERQQPHHGYRLRTTGSAPEDGGLSPRSVSPASIGRRSSWGPSLRFSHACLDARGAAKERSSESPRLAHPVLYPRPQCPWPKAATGQVLDGRFRLLLEEVGHGGMSTVFKAEEISRAAGAAVVVKVPLPIFSSGVGISWSLFQREEEIGRRLDHPLLASLRALAVDKRRSYVVTEYVPGRSLADRLRQDRALPEREALAIAEPAVRGSSTTCTAAASCTTTSSPRTSCVVPRSARFASSTSGWPTPRRRRGSRFVSAVPAIGSSGYVAPEQVRRKRGRASVDVYGVGAVLYDEMLTGKPPFGDDETFGVASGVPHRRSARRRAL